jgi:hypothetical protein
MKVVRLICVILAISQFSTLKAQTKWVFADEVSANFVITTTVSGNKIIGESRKDALKDYIGSMKFSLIKMASNLKYPEIIHFEGILNPDDQSRFSGIYNQLFSEGNFNGILYPDSIILSLINKENKIIKRLKGIKASSAPITTYPQTVAKMLSLTEAHLYDRNFLASKNWLNFKDKITQNSKVAEDELEIQVGFIAIAKDFPFTHYNVIINGPKTTEAIADNFTLTEKSSQTAILKIKAFEGGRHQIDSLIKVIASKKYTNLIIDLRDNGGGDNQTALPLMDFISPVPVYGGFFANRSWYDKFNRQPTSADYSLFNLFTGRTLDEFYKFVETGYGTYIKSIPSTKHFNGKLYVLTNQRTASTCEILLIGLKENKLATIVGKKTAGAALSGKKYAVNERFSLFIPIANYISDKGFVIDKNGITPDIEVKTGDELDYLLKNVIGL